MKLMAFILLRTVTAVQVRAFFAAFFSHCFFPFLLELESLRAQEEELQR